jgi:hypothetical protein
MRVAIIAFIVLAGSVAAGPAGAGPLGIYAGVSYAMVEKDSTRRAFEDEAQAVYDSFAFEPATRTASFDSNDSAYGFVVGWRLTEHIAFEGGYMDLGDVSYRERSDGLFVEPPIEAATLQQNIESSTSGIAMSALGILPLSYRWEVYARGGVLISNNTASLFISNGTASQKFRVSKSGFDMLAGVGISFSVVEIYSLRLEYQRVFDAGENDTIDPADVDMALLSVSVSF